MPTTSLADSVVAESTQPRLFTVAEAATYVNATERFIRKLIEERRLRYFKVAGWMVRLDRADLDALFQPVEPLRP